MRNSVIAFIGVFVSLSANAQFKYELTSVPDSATVYMNGEKKCTTPCKVRFYWHDQIDGKIIFELKVDGYNTWADTIFKKPYLYDFKEGSKLTHSSPKFKLDSITPVIGFDKIIAKFEDGLQVGSFTDRYGKTTPITWASKVQVGESAFNQTFYENMDKLGFQTTYNEKIELFKDEEDRFRLPRYIVGAEIKSFHVTMKRVREAFSSGEENKCTTSMDVEWKVLDKKTNKVVLTSTTNGVSHYRQSKFDSNPDNLLAFEDALYAFLNEGSFYELVNGTEQSIDYAASTDSTENPVRVIPKVVVPQFDKLSDMIKYANPACVTIVTDGGFGSGVVISAGGYVLSAYHVVDGVNRIQVKFSSGLTLDAELIAFDYQNDVALLDITGSGFNALPVFTGDVPLGEDVITIGTPASLDLGQSIAKGLVSGKRIMEDRVYLQADIAVSPGNSGGPLLNDKGEVIGIVQSKIVDETVEGIGFALPMDRALERLNLKVE